MILLMTGAPLYAVIGAVGIVFGIILEGVDIFPLFAMRIYGLMVAYSLVAVPLFIFMANLLQRSGIIEELFDAVFQWSGKIRGSLALATVLTGVILAAMIGVVGASVITLGLLALPAMLQKNYNRHLAVGTVCAAGSLGILIPPSIMPIFYSAATQVSVIDLFAGSILPGVLLCLVFCLYIIIMTLINQENAPCITEEEQIKGFWKKAALGKSLIPPIIIIACVLGSILAGVASPTEAAGVGAFAVIVLLALRKKLTFNIISASLYSTISATGMALWITFASTCFVGVYAMGDGHEFANQLVSALPGGKWGALIFCQVLYIFLGMFIDWIGICLLIVPIFSPILVGLGFDPIWVGIVFMLNMQMSFLTPPFGYALFFVKGVAPSSMEMKDIILGALPFLLLQALVLVLCSVFPDIVMVLPNLLG
ncbi:TRAP transporter large permease [Desulfotignum balticum]|uniref:TRAP transporter large permease n=1 Tax=Desulfotignum balticum TaxID=115781 RepID=UPI001469C371|nr:TRAP transporter large permease subunit [Desulfotignum balticum]